MGYPVDSETAREQRELEAERIEVEAAAELEHAARCRGGWLGHDDDGRPVACTRCRPHLMQQAPCRTCGVSSSACKTQVASRRGPCCDDHDHAPTPHAVRQEDTTDATPQPSAEAGSQALGREDTVNEIREVLRRAREADQRAEGDPAAVTAAATSEQLEAVHVLPARVVNSVAVRERAFRTVVVEDPDHGAITVRWRVKVDERAWRWKCDVHGATADPECVCAWSAALRLAEVLLGLTRIPTLNATQENP